MAASKAGAVFSIKPRLLLCRPRCAIGRTKTARSRLAALIPDGPPALVAPSSLAILTHPRRLFCAHLRHAFCARAAPSAKRGCPAAHLPSAGPSTALLIGKEGTMMHPTSVCRLAAVAFGVLMQMASTPTWAAGQKVVLAPHRAIYEMSLAEARGGAGVTAVSGRMVYELTGSACEGYTQNMRFVTQMTNQKGAATLTDLRSSSWEEGSG